MENPNYKKLIKVLEEVFQLNQADLDFGIYRIMNYKREEILQFLNEDLIPQVKEILSENLSGDKSSVQKELGDAVEAAQGLGMNPDDSPKVQQLRQLLTGSADIEAEENAVFAHLANFFKRYYEGGDFISLRRYKEGVYAIPYEGEEVKLHWANHDQYYIKTSEYLKNYAFKLSNGKSVRFLLAEASTEQNNNKSATGKERRFALYDEGPMNMVKNELQIFFTYEPAEKSVKQVNLLKAAFERLKTQIPPDFQEVLISNEKSKTDKQPKRTLLEKHIRDYTARYTFDYFIHKNLGKFLRQELDFFIKSEVLFLDDINTRDANDFVRQLSQVRALKSIGLKVIAFLEQLENFQKKLWLKKKFVVETQYCITLDRVPEELYPEIISNEQQIEEWKELFHIQDVKAEKDKTKELFDEGQVIAYSEPLILKFLKANPYLVLDTHFFAEEFKNKLISSIENIEEQINGVLINSENFQALNLINSRYSQVIKGIYIDPPYNADATEIIYKNGFKHSSWLSFIKNRVNISKGMLEKEGIFCITIDDYELHRLIELCNTEFGEENLLANVLIRNNPSGRSTVSGFSINHEYALFYANEIESCIVGRLDHSTKQKERYSEIDNSGKKFEWENLRKNSAASNRSDRPKQFYPILYNKKTKTLRIPDLTWNELNRTWHTKGKIDQNEITILPYNKNGSEKVWRFGVARTQENIKELLVKEIGDGQFDIYKKKYLNTKGVLPRTWWDNPAYSARDNGTRAIAELFKDKSAFDFPKSVYAVEDCLRVQNINKDDLVLDYFAGSGTTAHAVINLNREDEGNRKYILVEMGDHFDSVTKPRIQKVIYSKNWKDGKPIDKNGASHFFKYIRLESYEDAINNLSLSRNDAQSLALKENSDFREGYMLNYMLDTEVQSSLLNVSAFEDPYNYYLNITRQSEMTPTKVDMVETFNYLIGLVVERMDTIKGFRVVEGKNLQEERVLVIWRNAKEKDNNALNNFFQKMGYSTRDQEFNRIYVNGDNNLENLRTEEDRWKVVLIEEEFKRRMFEVEDI